MKRSLILGGLYRAFLLMAILSACEVRPITPQNTKQKKTSGSNDGGGGSLAKMPNIQQLALGNDHSCALVDGGVWCWGSNLGGQLGTLEQENANYSDKPLLIKGLETNVTHLAAGGDLTCGVKEKKVYCWGQIEDQVKDQRRYLKFTVQRSFTFSMAVKSLSVGENHVCALVGEKDADSNYLVECFGNDNFGQFVNNQWRFNGGVRQVQEYVIHSSAADNHLANLAPIPASSNEVPAPAASNGVPAPTASNGVPAPTASNGVPASVASNVAPSSIATRIEPTSISIKEFRANKMVSKRKNICFLVAGKEDDTIQCWDRIGDKILLERTKTANSNELVTRIVHEFSTLKVRHDHVSQIALGENRLCSATEGGNVFCRDTSQRNEYQVALYCPSQKDSLEDILAGGKNFNCAISDQDVRCWGDDNENGQLGGEFVNSEDGDFVKLSRVSIQNMKKIKKMAAGSEHICVTDLEKIQCWGKNNHGQVGKELVFSNEGP